MKNLNPSYIAYFLLRFALGLNVFLHGVVRLGPNYQKFVDWTNGLFVDSGLPAFAVDAFAHAIPILELVLGALILVGLLTLPALVGGTFVMISLMAGMCLLQKWEIVGLQMTYILIYAVLIFAFVNNRYSLDSLFASKGAPHGKK